jgi:uncharacterized phage protein (TIGR01671 family)
MRELKFKAWDKKNKEFIANGDVMNLYYSARCNAFMFDNDVYDLHSDIVFLQYTGLNDKNKTPIYEGDKVKFSVFDYNGTDTQYTGYVKWSGTRFMLWNSPDDEYYGSDGGFDLDWVLAQDDEAEVIGNIYEEGEKV